MKKVFYFSMLAAIGLFLSACSSSEDEVVNSDEGLGVVKTEFTISFPVRATATRQTSAAVQYNATDFRGITDIKLFPFVNTPAFTVKGDQSLKIPETITLTYDGASSGTIGYSSTTGVNQIDPNGVLFTTSKSHLYKDVAIPLQTQSFMFYGKAITTGFVNFTGGSLTATIPPANSINMLGDISFAPTAISEGIISATDNNITTYLTNIANAQTAAPAAVHTWSQCSTTPTTITNPETPSAAGLLDSYLEKRLADLYIKFTGMKAGSWTSVRKAVQELYTSVKDRDDIISTAIKAAITAPLDPGAATPSLYLAKDDNNDGILEFQERGDGITNTATTSFPRNMNLPDGAAYIKWDDSNKKFDFINSAANNEKLNSLNVAALDRYVYPAELYYRGVSGIYVSDVSKQNEYTNERSWSQICATYADGGTLEAGKVTSKTRSVAIADPVQYAVGRLDVMVKANSTPLYDNSEGTDHETTFAVNDPDATVSPAVEGSKLFKVTGVLIGNQRAVDYNFNTKTAAESYTIYDKTMNSSEMYLRKTATDAADANHTLVLETAEGAKVKIAIEFEYDSEQTTVIEGVNGLIYPGTRFYLIGELDPGTGSTTKVFEQDKYTVATINVKSLKNAYNVLPDLRSPQPELGLSIDLTWQAGFNQVIDIE